MMLKATRKYYKYNITCTPTVFFFSCKPSIELLQSLQDVVSGRYYHLVRHIEYPSDTL